MKLLFPYSMIIGVLYQKINWIAIAIGAIQFPVYAFIGEKNSKWKFVAVILHIFAAIAVFSLNDQIFNS